MYDASRKPWVVRRVRRLKTTSYTPQAVSPDFPAKGASVLSLVSPGPRLSLG